MEQLTNKRGLLVLSRLGRQRGIVVFISLIVLVVLTLASIGLIRSMDTATLVSGNMAFKHNSIVLADIGTEAAANELVRFINTSADAIYPASCGANGSCRYYPVMQALNTQGVPTAVNWSNVAKTSAISFPSTFNGNSVIPSGYDVQFVVERLCSGTLPITNLAANCHSTVPEEGSGGSRKTGAPVFSSVGTIFYRAIIRVSDAKGAETLTQVVLQR